MAVGLDRSAGATLARQDRLDAVAAQDLDDRVPHAVLKVVCRAAMKIGDASRVTMLFCQTCMALP